MLPGTPPSREAKLDLSPSSQPPPWITTMTGRGCPRAGFIARSIFHRPLGPSRYRMSRYTVIFSGSGVSAAAIEHHTLKVVLMNARRVRRTVGVPQIDQNKGVQ